MAEVVLDEVPEGVTLDEGQAGLRARQRPALAVAAGLGAAAVGAVGWALFTYLTGTELGLVAVAVGALVGTAVRRAGRGVDPIFGVIGGACAALGWAAGTLLTVAAMICKEFGVPLGDVLARVGLNEMLAAAVRDGGVLDILFLGIAVWEGWRLSFAKRG